MTAEDTAKEILVRLRAKKEERKKRREMLEDSLMADSEYKELSDTISGFQEKRKSAKSRLMKDPAIYQLNEAVKVVNDEIRVIQKSLFSAFFEIEKETGEQLSLFDNDGQMIKVNKSYSIK